MYKSFCSKCFHTIQACTCDQAAAYPERTLCQCGPNADVLLDNFRNDVSCRAIQTFKDHGLSLSELLGIQKKIPIIYPWDKEYDRLRYNVNRRFVAFPLGIVMARTTKDVVRTVKLVRKYNLHLVARSGSHCFENFSLTDGIILDQSRRTTIKFCTETKIAHLELGCLIGPVQKILSPYNLIFVGGTCPNNSVSLTLGGGIGFLTRKYGLSSDNLLEAEIVLADGTIVRASKDNYTDLFWALQGAGNGNFGIVTELVVRLHEIPKFVVFDLKYEFTTLKAVLDLWQRFAPFTRKRINMELDVFKKYILVTGQYLGQDVEKVKALLHPFFTLQPIAAEFKVADVADATRFHGGTGFWMPFFKNKSAFVQKFLPLPALEIIEHYMQKEIVGDEDHIELNALGGVMDEIEKTSTPFPYRKGTLYWVHFQCHWREQEQSRDKIEWVTKFYHALQSYTRGAYFNAPDIALCDYMQEYFDLNVPRLLHIKKKYDPTNFFRYQQSIPILDA